MSSATTCLPRALKISIIYELHTGALGFGSDSRGPWKTQLPCWTIWWRSA